MTEEGRAKYECCKAIRTAHWNFVTKLMKEIDKILLSESLTQEQYTRINVIHRQLEVKSSVLAELNKEALSLCDIGDIATEVEEAGNIVALIMEYKGKIELIKCHNSPEVTSTLPTSDGAPLTGGAQTHLPKLVLPMFKGDVTQWMSFWDLIKSAIHDNGQLTKVDKFNYLLSLLEGVAARSIKGLMLFDGNYNTTVELLQQ